MAQQVMRTSELELSDSSRPLRRPDPPRAGPTMDGGSRPAIVDDVVSSPGRPLDAAARTFLEPRFEHDLGRIRVHADQRAAQSAAAVDAPAYTVGHDVVFAAGRFAPHTNPGMALLAHEIAHALAPVAGTDGAGISRSEIPMPLDMVTEAQVGQVFDRIAAGSAVQVVSEVPIAVRDQAGNWVIGRIDRIVKLPDGTIKGVELKLDVTSPKTGGQLIYIPLANQGYLVEITGHAAGALGLPQGTRLTLSIAVISSENVASAMESLGLRPPPAIASAAVRVAGGRTPRAPSGFEAAPESAEQVPRSPSTVRTGTPPPGAVVPPGAAEQTVPVVTRPSSRAAPPAPSPATVAGSAPTAGVKASPVGDASVLLLGMVTSALTSVIDEKAAALAQPGIAAQLTPDVLLDLEQNPATHGLIVTTMFHRQNPAMGMIGPAIFQWVSVEVVEGETLDDARANMGTGMWEEPGFQMVEDLRRVWIPPRHVGSVPVSF